MLPVSDESGGMRKALLGVLVCFCAVLLVLAGALISVLIIYTIRTVFGFLIRTISTIAEVITAFVAAISSGVTVSMAIVAAAGSASFTFPAARVSERVLVAALVAACSMTGCMALVLSMATDIKISWDVGVAVVTAASVAVAGASSWAVGVMSLIERETQSTGIRMSSILDSARKNSHRMLRLLLKLHSGKQQDLDLVLIQTIKAGFLESTKVMLDAGADPNNKDHYDNTPLLLAAEMGNEPLVQLLLQRGARAQTASNSGGGRGSPLHHAAKWGYQRCMELLLEHGADVNAQDGLWRTPLMLAARYAKNPQHILCSLLEAGAQVNVVGCEQRTALHYAAARGINVQVLMVAGADMHAQDSEGNCPLHSAAIEGHARVLMQLLGEGANVNALNYQRRSPLHLACMRGQVDCVKALLSRGAQLERQDTRGHLPIFFACQANHVQIVHHLITHNSRVPGACLETAMEECYFPLAKLLLRAGVEDTSPLHRFLLRVPDIPSLSGAELLWFQDCVVTPHTLAHSARHVIRLCMSRRYFQRHVTRLPLPKPVQRYVAMMELWDEEGGSEDTQLLCTS